MDRFEGARLRAIGLKAAESGAATIDGKMQDDATRKQARVIVDLARQVAAKDARYAALYKF